MTQFLRDHVSDSEEVDTPLMLDGTYLSRNFATLGPLPDSRRLPSPSLLPGLPGHYAIIKGREEGRGVDAIKKIN